MERFKNIIEKGKVDLKFVSSGGILNLITRVFMIGVCLYALYAINSSTNPKIQDQPVPFLNVAFTLLSILGIYLLIESIRKLKTIFYEDNSSIEKKIIAVEKVAAANKWKLKSSEMNYYFFWENNWILQSYYITIVFDDKGFYINIYPSLDRVFDFGASQRHSNEIFDELKEHL